MQDLSAKLAAAQAEQRLPSVSAVVFRDGEVVWQEALGLADVDAAREATPDTQYRIGSITKTFTAVGIMQLRDAGELSLDDELTEHLPESAHAPTIGRMLAHASGLQREPPGEIWETMKAPSREELLAGTADAEQVLQPGSWWHYSNLAFALLGEVVARAHGGTWEEALQERILDPLGLVADDARAGRPGRPRLLRRAVLGRAAARARPRSRRCRRAREALVDDRRPRALGLVPRRGDDRVLERDDARGDVARPDDGRPRALGARVGHGLELYRSGEHLFVGHGGAMPGHLAGLVVNRKTRIGAAVLTNTGAGAGPEKLALDLAVAAIEALPPATEPWQPGEKPPAELEPLLGRWWTEGHEIVISWRKGRLEAQLVGGAPGRDISYLEAEGDDRWRVAEGRERGELLRVVRDAGGAIEKLYFATYPLRREPSTF